MKTSLLYGALHSLCDQFGNSIFKIFSFLINQSHDRTSSITRVHTTIWGYFTKSLAHRFIDSPKVVKEEIMTDINDLMQELWTSNNGASASGKHKFSYSSYLVLLVSGALHRS